MISAFAILLHIPMEKKMFPHILHYADDLLQICVFFESNWQRCMCVSHIRAASMCAAWLFVCLCGCVNMLGRRISYVYFGNMIWFFFLFQCYVGGFAYTYSSCYILFMLFSLYSNITYLWLSCIYKYIIYIE